MNRLTVIASLALAAGGVGLIGCDDPKTTTSSYPSTNTPTTQPTVGQRVDSAMERTGDAMARGVDKTTDAARDAGAAIKGTLNGANTGASTGDRVGPSGEELRDVLAQVAEAALTKDGLDDLVERFVDADRNRIGQSGQINGGDHNALVEQFRNDWKAKYGQDFDITNEEAAYPAATFMIAQGEIPSGAAGVTVEANRRADGTVTTDVDNRTGVDSPNSTSADTNRNDPGRNIATLKVAASHGMQAVSVPFISEAGGWKIDAKDSIDAAKLRANVINHLKMAHGMKDQWPANVNDAYAAVTHHVLMAVMDQQ